MFKTLNERHTVTYAHDLLCTQGYQCWTLYVLLFSVYERRLKIKINNRYSKTNTSACCGVYISIYTPFLFSLHYLITDTRLGGY